ncbi:hypothetical protein IL38_03455 [Actinopolyspora erythraea]|nr:acyl-CoA carboxylase subunit epsilon [Actinopolyspora erythraea]KGI82920.1 hypothetical protein IL38_03455 [Actinopolyspora erythraea]
MSELRVIRGDPDEYELAALTAVLSSLAAERPDSPGERDRRPARAGWHRGLSTDLVPSRSWRRDRPGR